jgi:hypothetical protein
VLVVLDRQLGSEDGMSLVPVVRARRPAAKIAIFSGSAMPESHVVVDAVLPKSEAFEALLERIVGILKS